MSDENDKPGREMSSVQFPYNDLDDAISVARAMHSAGGVPLDRDQLAAAIGISPTGGNFALKLSGARMFGVISGSQGRYELTALGFEILDPSRERSAKATAFLNVELYRKTYETFKGRQLPPRPVGLEQAFVQFGVSSKQKDKARQAFDRSARTAGFFPTPAEDRLVQPVVPAVANAPRSDARSPETEPDTGVPSRSDPLPGLNPFIQGLLSELPPAKSDWSMSDRAKWLQAAAQIFDLIYTGGGHGKITIVTDI